MEEVWMPCKGYEEYIEVSNQGRVRTFYRYVPSGNSERFQEGQILKPGNDKDGYQLIKVPRTMATPLGVDTVSNGV